MVNDANIQLVQKGYADFLKGDVAGVLAVLDENVEWSIPGELPDSGTHRGKAAVAKFFQTVAEIWTFQVFNPREYVASGDKVVAIGDYAATSNATGKAVAAEWVMVWTIRNGRVVAFREYTDTLALKNAITMRSAA
jgi:ketosteroid isomerase-like protein